MRFVDLGQVHPREAQAVEDRLHALVRGGIDGSTLVVQPTECMTAGADATWEEFASLTQVATPIDRSGGIELAGPGQVTVLCVTELPNGMTPTAWRVLLVEAAAHVLGSYGVRVAHTTRRLVFAEVDGVESVVARAQANVVDGVTTHGVTVYLTSAPGSWPGNPRHERFQESTLEHVLGTAPSPLEVGTRLAERIREIVPVAAAVAA